VPPEGPSREIHPKKDALDRPPRPRPVKRKHHLPIDPQRLHSEGQPQGDRLDLDADLWSRQHDRRLRQDRRRPGRGRLKVTHPSEIAPTIERAQQLNGEGRCVLLDVKTRDVLKISVYPLK
jgi:hypothetical protein